MAEAPRAVASRTCDLFSVDLRDDGILEYRPVPGAVLTHEAAMQVLALGKQIAGDRARPTLVRMEDVGRVDREAREFFASEQYHSLSSQTALVVRSPVSCVIGNFFVGLNRLQYPCKVFTDPLMAEAWLRSFAT
jgi:hypothetical protein